MKNTELQYIPIIRDGGGTLVRVRLTSRRTGHTSWLRADHSITDHANEAARFAAVDAARISDEVAHAYSQVPWNFDLIP